MKKFLATHKLFRTGELPLQSDVSPDSPEDLRQLLKQVGTNEYADGFFQFVTHQVFAPYFQLVHLQPSECHSFLKFGFGQLLFFQRKEYKVLNPLFNTVDVLGDAEQLGFIMDLLLCDRVVLENSFMIDVYEEAFPRLGAPDLDEMYTFVPALRLGGTRNAANVRRSRMAVEMSILLQV